MMTITKRFTAEELAFFKEIIDKKLSKAKTDLEFLEEQLQDAADHKGDEADWMDETAQGNDIEMLYHMIGRHKKHIRDLENALIRIHNKTYGICVVSGELIDKRRLMAVPTTTKSLAAKNMINQVAVPATVLVQERKAPAKTRIISRVISNSQTDNSLKQTVNNFPKDDFEHEIEELLNQYDLDSEEE